MSALPSVDAMREQIDACFSPEEQRRVHDWAATPEGREVLEAHRAELARLPIPATPEPLA